MRLVTWRHTRTLKDTGLKIRDPLSRPILDGSSTTLIRRTAELSGKAGYASSTSRSQRSSKSSLPTQSQSFLCCLGHRPWRKRTSWLQISLRLILQLLRRTRCSSDKTCQTTTILERMRDSRMFTLVIECHNLQRRLTLISPMKIKRRSLPKSQSNLMRCKLVVMSSLDMVSAEIFIGTPMVRARRTQTP